MLFIHVADTHLGKKNFKLEEREEDFLNAFSFLINFAIENKVDFIVHSGDVFDKPRPKLKILRFFSNELKRLREANIKFFTIPGSHDIGSEGTFLTFLDDLNLLYNLDKLKTPFNDRILLNGLKYKDAFLAGISGKRGNEGDVKKIIPKLESNLFNIFLFHYTVSSLPGVEKFYDISVNDLPKGFDYYAAGHYHLRNDLKYNGKPLVYPGSLEYCSIDEVKQKRGFYLVETKGKEIIRREFIEYKGREFKVKEINCNNQDIREVVSKISERIESSKDGILVLKFFGKLKKGRKRDIDKSFIEKIAKIKGYIHVHLNLSNLIEEGEEEISNIESKSINEIEKEFLKLQEYSEEEVNLAIKLINLLGNCEKGREDVAKEVAYNEIVKFLGISNDN